MTEIDPKPRKPGQASGPAAKPVSTGKMHQNVPVWSDPCCSCEAEPYWREVAEEMGIDLDDDGDDTPAAPD